MAKYNRGLKRCPVTLFGFARIPHIDPKIEEGPNKPLETYGGRNVSDSIFNLQGINRMIIYHCAKKIGVDVYTIFEKYQGSLIIIIIYHHHHDDIFYTKDSGALYSCQIQLGIQIKQITS